MVRISFEQSRRRFLKTALTVAGSAALPLSNVSAQPAAKYTRYNVMSNGGKKALASYAKGVAAMLKLPADHPQNWFRNAFIHLMDCPHGNWWFYVWHRGYLGYFEQTIRNLSGDPTFAMPYWDWTTLPQIPDQMFDGVLTPADAAYEPFTRNLAVFTALMKPALTSYWNGLSPAQHGQLNTRGYTQLENLWNDVTGFDPAQKGGVSGNIAWDNPCNARYLTRDNPRFDKKTQYNSSPFVVYSGLWPTVFYDPSNNLSFNSSKTSSHNSAPGGPDSFSVLEGFPHNKVHNYIGGVGYLDPGPYGYMTNFLSPVDPTFFLHHANMDRLWDVWTRKQKALKKPWLPAGQDLKTLSDEPFLFYADGKGGYVGASTAGEYLNMERFEYAYEPGFGEDVIPPSAGGLLTTQLAPAIKGIMKGNIASITLPTNAIKNHLAATRGATLIAQVTLPRPATMSSARDFDVIVGAPADVTRIDADSPYYAGTISFFGKMMSMTGMAHDATFAVPLPRAPEAFHALNATPGFNVAPNATVSIRVVPSQGQGEKTPATLKSLKVQIL